MERIEIEKAAVREVGKYIDNCSKLTSHLSDNDRTPIWDGDIFIYTDTKKDNGYFYGRVPVQVKGREVAKFSKKKISYSKLTRGDLENYRKDGGCIFFVAEVMMDSEAMDSETKKTEPHVYYCELSVTFITDLLKEKENVQYPTFHLIPVPRQKKDFTEKVIAFSDARYKNLVIREMEEIDGMEMRIDQLLSIIKCIYKYKKKSPFNSYIAEIKTMKDERKSIWNVIKKNYRIMTSKKEFVVDESIRDEIDIHANYLLSNLYNSQSKWMDKIMARISEIIKKDINGMNNDDSYHLIYNYAYFLLSQNKYHLIGNYFNKALRIAREASSLDSQRWRVAETRFSRAELHRNLCFYDKAIKDYTKALTIYLKELKKITGEPEVEKLDRVLKCTHNLAFLYDKLNYPKQAIVLYEGLLKSLRLLANDCPAFFNRYLFRALIDYESFYKYQNNDEEKMKILREANSIYKNLHEDYITDDTESAALIHESLGIFHQELICHEEAEKEFKVAINIYKVLAKTNRDVYMIEEAKIHKRLANLYSKNDFKKAEKEYNEAFKIYEKYDEANPGIYKRELASIYTEVANLYLNQNHADEAEDKYNMALEKYNEFEKVDVFAYKGDVADIYYNLGKLHADSGDFLKAEKELKYAYDIHKKFACDNPQKYNAKVAEDLMQLQAIMGNRLKEAEKAVTDCHAFYDLLAKENPNIWKDYLFSL